VKSTIQATLRQLFTIVFETLSTKCKELITVEDYKDLKRRSLLTTDERKYLADLLKPLESDNVFHIGINLLRNLS